MLFARSKSNVASWARQMWPWEKNGTEKWHKIESMKVELELRNHFTILFSTNVLSELFIDKEGVVHADVAQMQSCIYVYIRMFPKDCLKMHDYRISTWRKEDKKARIKRAQTLPHLWHWPVSEATKLKFVVEPHCFQKCYSAVWAWCTKW